MNKYEVIIDFECKHFFINAETKEEAEQKGVEEYEKHNKKNQHHIIG